MKRIMLLLCILLGLGCLTRPAQAQPLMGDAAVTCMGDNTTSFVFGYINVQNASAQPVGWNWNAPMYHHASWTRTNLGQVFGIALDGAGNAYVTATACYFTDAWGPGGSGAVYKIAAVTGTITTLAALPNTGSVGLGNICYDPDHNQLFVTNTEDGKIYRYNMTGALLSTYDPFVADGGTPGAAQLGERLWGIAYRKTALDNGRVYFSRWREDQGNMMPLVSNEIHSIALNAAGAFTGTSTLEITLPPISGSYSNPVSDIEFSKAGRMLLAERPMTSYTSPSAHTGRMLEYQLVAGSWVSTGSTFSIGEIATQQNCAGGCDYGYKTMNAQGTATVDCDSTVWVSGDGLHFRYPPTWPYQSVIYGFQRMPATGGSSATSVLIDADGDTINQDKTQIGDIDIYKNCAVADPCSQVSRSLVYDNTQAPKCCWNLTITNSYQANFWTHIRLDILTAGVTFSSASAPAGWGISSIGSTHVVYNPSTGQIPLGNSGPMKFCLNVGVNPPQKIKLTWVGPNGVTCVDTLTIDCQQDQRKCGRLVNVDLKCKEYTQTGGAIYSMAFQIQNDITNTFSMSKAGITVTSPAGVSITPFLFSFPAVPPGGTSTTLNAQLLGAKPGDTVCLSIETHNADSTFCCRFDTCLVMPKCKSCCDSLRVTFANTVISYGFTGAVTVNTQVTSNYPLRQFSATVISATQRIVCGTNTGTVTNVAAPIIAASFAPVPALPGPFGLNTSSVMWGTSVTGSVATNAPLSLTLKFPPLPSWNCRDTLRFCIKYTYQDTACRTCDTTICYTRVRRGIPWFPFDTDIKLFPFEPGREDGGGSGGTKDENGRPQGGEAQTAATITMASPNSGTLNITSPTVVGGDLESAVTIRSVSIEPEGGVDLLGATDAQTGVVTQTVDRTATIAFATPVATGQSRSIALVYDNPLNALVFRNFVVVSYSMLDNPNEIFEALFVVYARTPAGKGGDVLATDQGISLTNVRTYGLQFTNSNPNRDDICRVVITVTSDGDDLIAYGPGVDNLSAGLKVYRDGEDNPLLLAEAPAASQAVEGSLSSGETVTPIYITVCGGADDVVTLEYTTFNTNGEVVTSGSVEANTPLAAEPSDVPIGATTGGSIGYVNCIPNPMTQMAMFSMTLPADEQAVSLVITDPRGIEVARVIDRASYAAGTHEVAFNAATLPSGTYYYTLRTRTYTQTRKLQIVR